MIMIVPINILNILSWAVFGLIAGYVTHIIDPADVGGGVVGTMLTGIIGAFLGGFLGYYIFGVGITGFNIQSFLVAIIGGLIFAAAERLIFRKSEYRGNNQYGLKGGRSTRKPY